MPRYIAFLRAINVGGHVVKMQVLKELFERLGFANVETFIASGNVIFQSPAKSAAVEEKIERLLEKELGYAVQTFVRSDVEVARIAAFEPYAEVSESSTLYIGLLKHAPDAAVEKRLLAAQTERDAFRLDGREIYWRCRGPSSESTFSGTKLERTLGMPTTLRNANTLRRLATKYPPES
jgi:uncharacterized protein (DUF1697 family)